MSPVTFLNYDSSPPFVVVRDKNGVRLRIPREELFNLYRDTENVLPFQVEEG
jgi:hypothetical protein